MIGSLPGTFSSSHRGRKPSNSRIPWQTHPVRTSACKSFPASALESSARAHPGQTRVPKHARRNQRRSTRIHRIQQLSFAGQFCPLGGGRMGETRAPFRCRRTVDFGNSHNPVLLCMPKLPHEGSCRREWVAQVHDVFDNFGPGLGSRLRCLRRLGSSNPHLRRPSAKPGRRAPSARERLAPPSALRGSCCFLGQYRCIAFAGFVPLGSVSLSLALFARAAFPWPAFPHSHWPSFPKCPWFPMTGLHSRKAEVKSAGGRWVDPAMPRCLPTVPQVDLLNAGVDIFITHGGHSHIFLGVPGLHTDTKHRCNLIGLPRQGEPRSRQLHGSPDSRGSDGCVPELRRFACECQEGCRHSFKPLVLVPTVDITQ